MTFEFSPPIGRTATAYPALLVNAARCWRGVRDDRQPIQPLLVSLLSRQGCAILAPVLDSLMHCYETALGRPLAVGADGELTDDERLLVALVSGSARRAACLDCPKEAARALFGADHAGAGADDGAAGGRVPDPAIDSGPSGGRAGRCVRSLLCPPLHNESAPEGQKRRAGRNERNRAGTERSFRGHAP